MPTQTATLNAERARAARSNDADYDALTLLNVKIDAALVVMQQAVRTKHAAWDALDLPAGTTTLPRSYYTAMLADAEHTTRVQSGEIAALHAQQDEIERAATARKDARNARLDAVEEAAAERARAARQNTAWDTYAATNRDRDAARAALNAARTAVNATRAAHNAADHTLTAAYLTHAIAVDANDAARDAYDAL